MRKSNIFLTIILSLFVLMAGCWGRRELNEIALITGFGVDKVGDQYLISAQIADPSEIAPIKGGAGRTPVITYQASGYTLTEAVRRMSTMVSRYMYIGHLRIFILGEEVAKQGISPGLDLLARLYELRSDFYMVLAKGNMARDVLQLLTPLEKVPTTYLFYMLQRSEKFWTPTLTVNPDELRKAIMREGDEAVIPIVEIKGQKEAGEIKDNVETVEPKAYLRFTGVGVFKKDKLIGKLNEDESSGYNYLKNRIYQTAVDIPCKKNLKDTIEIKHAKAKLDASFDSNIPKITGTITVEGDAGELQCPENLLTKPGKLHNLEVKTEEMIKEQVEEVLRKAQKEYQSDIFGFGDLIHRTKPQEWKKLRQNWNEIFPKLPVEINVQVKIRSILK